MRKKEFEREREREKKKRAEREPLTHSWLLISWFLVLLLFLFFIFYLFYPLVEKRLVAEACNDVGTFLRPALAKAGHLWRLAADRLEILGHLRVAQLMVHGLTKRRDERDERDERYE
jgi:hypothetical protein